MLEGAAEEAGYNRWETIEFVIAFVQGLEYVSDNVSTGWDDYPRYAAQTLLEQRGDCEDTSILTAAFLWHLGYSAILLFYEADRHAAVGVWSDWIPGGSRYMYQGREYYYLETTTPGWQIGTRPEGIRGVSRPLPLGGASSSSEGRKLRAEGIAGPSRLEFQPYRWVKCARTTYRCTTPPERTCNSRPSWSGNPPTCSN